MINYAVTILVAVVSSTGGWSILQYFFSRKVRNLELDQTAAKTRQIEAETVAAAVAAEENKRELLAAAQLTAQRAALESASERHESLRQDYEECRHGLREVRVAAFTLIDVVEMMLARFTRNGDRYAGELSAKDFKDARAAIIDAREHLNK